MRQMTVRLVCAVAIIIAMGGMAHRLLYAGQGSVKVTELLKTELTESPGKEGSLFLVEIAPGGAVGKHFHPGDAFAYIVEGVMTLEVAGKPPVTLKPGESGHVSPKQVHDDKNASTTAPVKFVVFHVAEKGQPLAIPAQ
jgi:quercetin dioxygenase-like cupin family protein